MSLDVRIGYLADHPEALPALEQLFLSEWADYYGATGLGDARQDLVAYSNHGRLPVAVVAFLGSKPCGVAALKADSISTHQHLTPWVGAGMVAPQFRRHGIGARLLSALEDVARDLGFTTIYSGTITANSLLSREGWQLREIVQYDGEMVSIYEKTLEPSQ